MDNSASRPYPGSRPFRQADQTRFFGRADDVKDLTKLWKINRLTFIVGQAGRGKTSLLEAGIVPALLRDGATVLPVGRLSYGGTFPFAALPAHNPYTLALLRSWSPGESATRLAGLTIKDFVGRLARKGPVLAAIDPADELLADPGPRIGHQQRFLEELAEALTSAPSFHLLVVAREEAADLFGKALGQGARFDVPRLTWPGAFEAVTRPAALAGRPFDDGAAEELLADLRTSRITLEGGTERVTTDGGVEPALLQIVCEHMWAALPADDGVITVTSIRTSGDVNVALEAYWGAVIAGVARDHGITVSRLSAWLRSTFITEHGARNKTYEGTTTTAGLPNAVVRALEDRYVLIGRLQSGERWYELLSDRLIEPLRRAHEVRPAAVTPEACLRAAERALARGELDLAERNADKLARLPHEAGARIHADARTLLGNIAFERDRPAQAETWYREAAELFGTISDTQAMAHELAAVGQALVAQGRYAKAVDELHAAAGRIPSDLVVKVDLALALWQLGTGHAAVTVLDGALGIDGGNVAALEARGEILAALGEAREAMRDLDRVIDHGRPATRAARGLALAELGDVSAARKEIKEAIAEAPHNGPVLLYAARAYRESGDDSAAGEYAQQAVDATDPPLSPPHRDAARELARGVQE